jgi:DUF1009 family protein
VSGRAAPVAIVCGGGSLPGEVAARLGAVGRAFHLILLSGIADPALARHPHDSVHLGKIASTVRLAKAAGCAEMVLVGGLVRPRWRDIRIDIEMLHQLPSYFSGNRGGDNRLLTWVIGQIEARGLAVRGVHEIVPDLLVPEGALGSVQPDAEAVGDARQAMRALSALGPFDVGQAAVIIHGRIVAIEGAEGTDGLLARVADMRRNGRVKPGARDGVLVKIAKPGQDRRIDLPTIGPQTIAGLQAAGLAGLVVEARSTLMADGQALVVAADRAGLFVIGVPAEAPVP